MSADIENFRQAVQRFDELIVELERTDDKLSSNFERYITLSDTLGDSVHNQRGIIEAIDNLMIKGTNIVDNINTLNNNTKTINKNTIDTIKKEFEEFDYHIKKTMSSVVNSIDLSTFKRQVEDLFNDKISSLESEVRRLNSNNNDLEKLNTTIKSTLKTAKNEMNDSINQFNTLSKVVNWKVIVSVLFGGMFAGALLMMFFGLNIAKSQIFKDEQMAISEYKNKTAEMESKYIAASELEKVAREYEIKFIHDKDGKYILIPGKKVENAYKSNTNWQVWKLY